MRLLAAIRTAAAQARQNVQRKIAKLWQYMYVVRHLFTQYQSRYGGVASSVILLLLVAGTFYLSPALQSILDKYYVTEDAIQGLRSFILTIGSALIGAAAIVTSLVLFAMQVNIERMPHGLFHRLSRDGKLLTAFTFTFLLAITVATLSTLLEQVALAYVILFAAWCIFFILWLFRYSYRRALVLINPLQQLRILTENARRELRRWDRRAERARPLFEPEARKADIPSFGGSTHDLSRTAYFQIYSRWTDGSKRSIRHAISFSRHYAEQGDYEVSAEALTAVVAINREYINTKGKTFYTTPPLTEDPRSRDVFITDTLELLRQNAQMGITRRDEQQVEQSLQSFNALVQLYLRIDYSNPHASKVHAHLAATYLSNVVQALLPHDMVDVLLEGERLIGQSARQFLVDDDPNEIAYLTEEIAAIVRTGCAKEYYQPVMMEGVKQLAVLTFDLLRSNKYSIKLATDKVCRDITSISKICLGLPDTPVARVHSTVLGPFYSSSSTGCLRFRLGILVDSLSQEQADSEDAKSVIRNVEEWADGLHRTTKELLLAAIRARSNFTHDMIRWIVGITDILIVASNAPACYEHIRTDLREHARWLIATLTWIPDDRESIRFVGGFQVTEALFDAAMCARSRGGSELSKSIGEYLLSWTFKGGRYTTRWGVLERGLCAYVAFVLTDSDGNVDEIKSDIRRRIRSDRSPDPDTLKDAARRIRQRVDKLPEGKHWPTSIEAAISKLDYRTVSTLLCEIADILDPDIE